MNVAENKINLLQVIYLHALSDLHGGSGFGFRGKATTDSTPITFPRTQANERTTDTAEIIKGNNIIQVIKPSMQEADILTQEVCNCRFLDIRRLISTNKSRLAINTSDT